MATYGKLVYPVCCGMDVHKSFIFACIAITDLKHPALEPELKTRRFSTFTGDLRKLCDWLTLHNCRDVCMESTGKYWIPVFNVLESRGVNVCLTHPKYVKAIKGKKTDKRDAIRIADLFRFDQVRSSFIPPAPIRQLRDLCRYYVKLTYVNTSEKNRAQNCLTMCNFKLDDVFADVFGKSATRVLDALLEHGNSNFDVAPLLYKSCKATIEEVYAALDGELSLAQAEKLKLIRQHKAAVDSLQDSLESLILKLAEPYAAQIDLLLTVPGIADRLTAIRILAEIGADMSVFETSKQLVSWAGLCPQNDDSGGKKKTTRIARAGQYLKPLLVQVALAVTKSNKHVELKNKFQALKKRRGGKKAVIAIARKLLTAIWHMLSKNEPYTPQLPKAADKPPAHRVISSPAQAYSVLLSLGYTVEIGSASTYSPPVEIEISA
jgi:transposase